MSKIKISLRDITYGPTSSEVDALVATLCATELATKGYRVTSNAYCTVSRVDTDNWLTILAAERRCSVADFYNVDGSGVSDHHADYYCRVFSKDKLTVHPSIIRYMKRFSL